MLCVEPAGVFARSAGDDEVDGLNRLFGPALEIPRHAVGRNLSHVTEQPGRRKVLVDPFLGSTRDGRMFASGGRLQAAGVQVVAGCRCASGCRLQVAGCRLQVAGVAGCR